MKAKFINPSLFNLFIPISITTHLYFPIKILISSPFNYLGIVFILSGLILNNAASKHLRENQTLIDFNHPPNRMVSDGPFRLSRNPIYLSGFTVLFGMAILLGSLVTFCFPMLLFLLLNHIYIPLEEKEMEEMFGEDYVKYKHSVRRWL